MLEGKIHNWATYTFCWKYEPHEVTLCDIHVIPTCVFLFLSGLKREGKSDMITILKYFEPTIAVAQLQIVLNKKENKSSRLESFHILSDFFTLI